MKNLIITISICLSILGCSYATIYYGSIYSDEQAEQIQIVMKLESFFLESGFEVVKHDLENQGCKLIWDEKLCSLGQNSEWEKWTSDHKKILLWVGVQLDDNQVSVRLVPQPNRNSVVEEFGEKLNTFLSSQFDRGDYRLLKGEEPEIFR